MNGSRTPHPRRTVKEDEMAENISFLAAITVMFVLGFYEVANFAVTQLA